MAYALRRYIRDCQLSRQGNDPGSSASPKVEFIPSLSVRSIRSPVCSAVECFTRQKETQDCWISDPDFDEAVRLGSSATSSQQFDSDVVDDGSGYCAADTVVNMGRQMVNNEMAWLGSDATFQQPRDRWFKSSPCDQ
jgi:hypothetical protein